MSATAAASEYSDPGSADPNVVVTGPPEPPGHGLRRYLLSVSARGGACQAAVPRSCVTSPAPGYGSRGSAHRGDTVCVAPLRTIPRNLTSRGRVFRLQEVRWAHDHRGPQYR